MLSSRSSSRFTAKNPPLTLDHFLQRQRVLTLWRRVVRATQRIPPQNPARTEWRSYAREEIERSRYVRDLSQIRYLISTGNGQVDQMQRYLDELAK